MRPLHRKQDERLAKIRVEFGHRRGRSCGEGLVLLLVVLLLRRQLLGLLLLLLRFYHRRFRHSRQRRQQLVEERDGVATGREGPRDRDGELGVLERVEFRGEGRNEGAVQVDAVGRGGGEGEEGGEGEG